MLQTLRKGAAGWVAKLFFAVLVLSFAVWGIADVFRFGGGGQNAAVVGGRNISLEEYRQAYNNEIRRISLQAKRVITPEQARMAGIGERVLGDLVNEAAIDQRVKALGLSLSDEEVARQVQADDMFKGQNGTFDPTVFRQILRQNNLTEKDYLRLQRQFSARKQLTDALAADVAAPDALRQAIHAFNTDSRSIAFIELKPEDPAAVPPPSADALRKFFDARKAAFRAPEYRKLALVSLDPKTLAATKTIPEAELRAYYDANKPSFGSEEKRSIEQITFPSLEEAKAASDAIRNGKLFEQVMVERGVKPEDAFLGDLTRAQMFDPKIADAAFSLKQGEVSGPVQGEYSNVILRVTGVQQQKVKPFDEVKDQIGDLLAVEQAKKDVAALHDKIDEARLGGATLEEVAKANGLQARVIEAVDSRGYAPDGKPVADVPEPEKTLAAAFAAEVGGLPDPVSVGDGYVYFDVRGVTPARDRSFEEAQADVERRWREEEARKRLDARAAQALKDLQAGKPLDDVAAALKVEVQQAETTRTGGAPSIKPGQATAVFQTPVEGFGSTAADETGARLVFHVVAENIRPFDPTAPDDSGQIDRVAQSLGIDIVSAFVQKLRDDLGTTFDPAAIAQVGGGEPG